MSIDVSARGSNDRPPAKAVAERHGFFSLYKRGQGYWTRLGTALASGAVILFIAWFVFEQITIFQSIAAKKGIRFAIAAGVAGVLCLIVWWLMNAPRRAQFLIDTDSELKKVNWAGWPELIASTRVVVVFMLLIAATLFIFDTQFHAFFFSISVFLLEPDHYAGLVTGVILGLVLLATSFGLLRHADTKTARVAGGITLTVGLLVLATWITFAVLTPLNAVPKPAL
jgi:preprotein translocase subunit SecE